MLLLKVAPDSHIYPKIFLLELSAFCSIFYQTHAGAINISEKYLVKPNNFAIFAPSLGI
jgi:hypothetical protein